MIEVEESKGVRVRLALVDAISSNPGVIVPWEALTKMFRSKGVIRCSLLSSFLDPSLIQLGGQFGRRSAPDWTAPRQPARIDTRLLGVQLPQVAARAPRLLRRLRRETVSPFPA